MKVLGVTGGIGMGKSAAAELLRKRGVPVVDTDDLAREVVRPGQPALGDVAKLFGTEIIGPGGELRRSELARRVFADEQSRRKLEAILHPRIRELWRTRVAEWRGQGHAVGVVIIPLLFETGAERELDATLCVACSERTQYERLVARGWSSMEMTRRLRAQLPVETKINKANYVVWTEGTLEIHGAQLDCVLSRLRAKSG